MAAISLDRAMNGVFAAEDNAKSDVLFESTHVAFKKLVVKKNRSERGTVLEEKELYNYLHEDNGHQNVLVLGNVGVGKSNLLRWLYNQFKKDPNEVTLYIPRTECNLASVYKRILEIDELSDIEEKPLNIVNQEEYSVQKARIYYEFLLQLEFDDSETISNIRRKRFIELFKEDEYKVFFTRDGGIADRIVKGITTRSFHDEPLTVLPTDVFDKSLLNIEEDLFKSERAAAQVNRMYAYPEYIEEISALLYTVLGNVLERVYGNAKGFYEAFFVEVRKELKKKQKNLTIIIDNLYGFSGIDNDLLNVLTTEHTGIREGEELCRLRSISAITHAAFDNFYIDSYRERVNYYVFISDDWLLNLPASICELVAKYLYITNVLVANKGDHIEDKYELIEKQKIGDIEENPNLSLHLWPFNEISLLNLSNFQRKKQGISIRRFLKDIIMPLYKQYVEEPNIFPGLKLLGIENTLEPDVTLLFYISSKYEPELANRLYTFIQVWGDSSIKDKEDTVNREESILGIPRELFESIQLPFDSIINERPIPYPSGTIKKNEDYKIEKAHMALEEWIKGNKTVLGNTDSDRYIRDAVTVLNEKVKECIDWEKEGVSFDNVNKYRWSINIIIGMKNIDHDNLKSLLLLNPDEESRALLDVFLSYIIIGNKSWNFEGASEKVYFFEQWLERNKRSIVYNMNHCSDDYVDYNKQLIILQIILKALSGEITIENYSDIMPEKLLEKMDYKDGHSEKWEDLFDSLTDFVVADYYNPVDEIIDYYNVLSDVGGGKSVFLDYAQLKRDLDEIKEVDIDIYLKQLEARPRDIVKARNKIKDYLCNTYKKIQSICNYEQEYGENILSIIRTYWDYESNPSGIYLLLDRIISFYDLTNSENEHSSWRVFLLEGDEYIKSINKFKLLYTTDNIFEKLLILASVSFFYLKPLSKMIMCAARDGAFDDDVEKEEYQLTLRFNFSIEQRFYNAIKEYTNMLNSEKSFKSLMRDIFYDCPRECALIIAGYNVGIVEEIKVESNIDNRFMIRMAKKIVSTTGASSSNAVRAVNAWIKALDGAV